MSSLLFAARESFQKFLVIMLALVILREAGSIFLLNEDCSSMLKFEFAHKHLVINTVNLLIERTLVITFFFFFCLPSAFIVL